MIVDSGLPEKLSVLCVEAEDVRFPVAEEDAVLRRTLAGDWSDREGIPHDGAIFKGPVNAACLRIQRIDVSIVAAYENTAGRDSWLGVGGDTLREAENPLQFQSRHVRGGQASDLSGLKPRI